MMKLLKFLQLGHPTSCRLRRLIHPLQTQSKHREKEAFQGLWTSLRALRAVVFTSFTSYLQSFSSQQWINIYGKFSARNTIYGLGKVKSAEGKIVNKKFSAPVFFTRAFLRSIHLCIMRRNCAGGVRTMAWWSRNIKIHSEKSLLGSLRARN